jgi:SAM-dependent methyltransferase
MRSRSADANTLSPVDEPNLPYPPLQLAHRVGSLADAVDPFDYYDQLGRETREGILAALPPDWDFAGKRILDFGCGAGRTLRHFTREAVDAELWGCDIDGESIHWMQEQMCPPFHAFANGPEPPLDLADASFDLIWAISVFTHLAADWSRWLLELHRLLKPDALLFVTFMGRGMSQEIAGEPWNDNDFGMNVLKSGQSWDLGGPMVMHSPWWIEAHWGRAFEIVSLVPDGFANKPWLDHGSVLMRKRDATLDPAELERIAPGDARETRALVHNVKQLHAESRELRTGLDYVDAKLEENTQRHELLEAQISDLTREGNDARAHAQSADQEILALRAAAADLHRETDSALRQAAAARERSMNSAARLLEVEEVLAQSKSRIFALEEAVDTLGPRLERADRVMSAMKASVSWRITAPLRVLRRSR